MYTVILQRSGRDVDAVDDFEDRDEAQRKADECNAHLTDRERVLNRYVVIDTSGDPK
jgi:hypothetical protein